MLKSFGLSATLRYYLETTGGVENKTWIFCDGEAGNLGLRSTQWKVQ
jgi:hypothetical protein